MRFVLDASVTLAWCFDDTTSVMVERALDALQTGGEALVPSLWRLEVANVLVIAERRQRLVEADLMRFTALLGKLAVQVIPDTPEIAVCVALARRHGLTAYDATYLDLAQRSGLPLATLDDRMATAARVAGVALLA